MARVRVMVVDDSAEFRELAIELLGLEGDIDVVGAAASGEEAIERVGALRPDVVVMDVTMPGMTGLEAVQHLKASGLPPRVVLMSIHDTPEHRAAATAAGADGYLGKWEFATGIAAMIRSVARRQTPAVAESSAARLRTLTELTQLISSSLAIEDILRAIARAASQLLSAQAAVFWVADEGARTLTLRACSGHGAAREYEGQSVPYGAGGMGWVAEHRRALHIPDVEHDDRIVFRDVLRRTQLKSFLGVPLIQEGDLLGVLGVHRRGSLEFERDEQDLLDVLVAQAAAALRTARLNDEARRIRDLLESIAEHSADAIVITDVAGQITYFSPRAERMFGRRADDVIGRSLVQIWGDGEALRTPDGRPLKTTSSTGLLRDGAGAILSRVVVIRDITDEAQAAAERAQLEAQLRQAQKMEAVGQLAGGVAHDFNNLLTVIMGAIGLIAEECPAEHVRRHIEIIETAYDGAAGLINRLLAFSRRQVVEPTILDLNSVITDVTSMLRRLIGEDIDLRTPLASRLGTIYADRNQMEQIVINLVINARDAMPEGGTLTIETADVEVPTETGPQPFVTLVVSDTGAGMDATTRARIFEPFFTTKGAGSGTGLGLPTVLAIVEQAGGRIEVESAVGHGSTFRIFLPRADGVVEVAARRDESDDLPTGTETILIVEDSERVRTLARDVLVRRGYRVLAARDGADALRVVEGWSGPIHLLLTDVVMPGMNGREAADQLVSRHPEMLVVFMSGYTDDTVLRHGIVRGDVRFLPKPFNVRMLARTVREALDAGRGVS